MLEESLSAASPSSSTAPSPPSRRLSALVREKVRKKVLENMNKKVSFNSVDARMFAAKRQDEFNKWVCESGAYEDDDDDDDDDDDNESDLIPLRKASSEPILKGRGLLKHRVRYKPYAEHPLMTSEHGQPDQYSEDIRHPDRTPVCRTPERKEAQSPVYNAPVEAKVTQRGARGIPLLFPSPSMPNINLASTLMRQHFPYVGRSLTMHLFRSTRDLEAPLHPVHPTTYLEMLKTQYSTNHRFLHDVLLQHGQDPKEIDLFHQRYILKSPTHSLTDEDRVKQLLESQNKLYLRLVDLLSLSPSKVK